MILLFFYDANESFENLGNDLCIISNWAYQWKLSYDPGRSRQAQSHPVYLLTTVL